MIPDAGEELKRALRSALAGFSGTVAIEEPIGRPWASVTFSGARHSLALSLQGTGAGAAADAFLDGLAEREFALRGHILADIVLVGDRRRSHGKDVRLVLEALTVVDS